MEIKALNILILLSVIVSFSSCRKEIPEDDMSEPDWAPLTLYASVGDKVLQAKSISRLNASISGNSSVTSQNYSGPIMESSFPDGSRIGISIFTKDSKGNYYPYSNHTHMDSENLLWVKESNGSDNIWKYIPSDNSSNAFYLDNYSATAFAYYPYKQDAFIGSSSTNSYQLTIIPGNTDFLFGTSEESISTSSPLADIEMKHLMSLVSFTFTASSDYHGDSIIEDIKLYGVSSQLEFNILTQEKIIGSEQTDLEISYYSDKEQKYESISSLSSKPSFKGSEYFGSPTIIDNVRITPGMFHSYVIPNQMISSESTGLYIEAKIDGNTYKTFLPNNKTLDSGQQGVKWEAGKAYNYNIILNGSKVITINNLYVSSPSYENGGNPDFDFESYY